MPSAITEFIAEYGELLAEGTLSTIVMVIVPTLISYIIGTALGVVLYLTAAGSLRPIPALNAVLGWVVNILRSFPFIVLMVFIIPFTRLIMGTGSGILGTIPPLVLSASPFIARMIEQSLAEVPRESVEAVEACGASVPRIVFSALLPEALPSIVRGVAVVLISVLGYTAMAGAIGAGGLGDIAVRYGYYRRVDEVMIMAVIILVVIVQVIQSICDLAARKVDHRGAKEAASSAKRAKADRAAAKRSLVGRP